MFIYCKQYVRESEIKVRQTPPPKNQRPRLVKRTDCTHCNKQITGAVFVCGKVAVLCRECFLLAKKEQHL